MIKLLYNRFDTTIEMGDLVSRLDVDTTPARKSLEAYDEAIDQAARATEALTTNVDELEANLDESSEALELIAAGYEKYRALIEKTKESLTTLSDEIKLTNSDTLTFRNILDKVDIRDAMLKERDVTMGDFTGAMGDATRLENMLYNGRERYNKELAKSVELEIQEEQELRKMEVKEIDDSFKSVSKSFDSILAKSNQLNGNVNKIVDKFDNSMLAGAMSRGSSGDFDISYYGKGNKAKGIKKGDVKQITMTGTRESKWADTRAELEKQGSGFKGLTNLIASYKKETKEAEEANNEFAKSTAGANGGIKAFLGGITGTLVKLRILTGFVRGLISFFGQLYDKAADYQESLNLYTIALGEYAEQGRAWAEKISSELYLDPTNVLQYTGALYNLTKGLGVAADDAYVMATNLTQLAYDMSSYLNIGVDTAMAKIQSAIVGQSRAVQTAGVAMQIASLQELAYEMGIEKTVSTMTQAEKTYLRYIQLMKSTTKMQKDLGRTIISPANAVRTLKTQFQLLARSIGSVLIPIIMQVLPYVMALTKQLDNLAKRLAKMLGYKLLDWDVDTSNISYWEDYVNALEDVEGAATSAGSSISRTLAAFDDLNVVESEGGGSGSGGVGGLSDDDLDKLKKAITGYDMLAEKTDEWDNAIAAAEGKLKAIEFIVGGLLTSLAVFKIGKGLSKFLTFVSGASGAELKGLAAVKNGLKIVWGLLSKIAAPIAAIVASLTIAVTWGDKIAKTLADTTYEATWFEEAMERVGITLSLIPGNQIIAIIAGVTAGFKKSVQEIDMFAGVSEKATDKLEPLVDKWKSSAELINDLNFKPRLLNESDIETLKTNFSVLTEGVRTGLAENKSLIDTFYSGLDEDTATSLNDLKTKFDTYYTEKNANIDAYEKAATEIIDRANNENRALTEGELKQLSVINNKLLEEGARAYSETEEEFKKLSIRIGEEADVIQVEQASKYLKTALETKDKAIETAKEEYEGVVLEAQKLRDAGVITDEEYNKMVEAARKKRDDDIDAAETEYDKIYKTIQEKLGASGKYIDKKTGEIKSNWQVWLGDIGSFFTTAFDNWKTGWNEIIRWITEKWENLKNWFKDFKFPKLKIEWSTDGAKEASGWVKDALKALNLPTKLPKLNVKWYAEGGYPDSGDLFFANENGRAEYITSIGNKTAVANQDQMTTALADTIVRAIGSIPVGNNTGDIVVYVGNDKVYQGQGEYQSRQTDRYGRTYVKI